MAALKQEKIILALSIPLALLLIAVSLVGLLTPNFYAKETFNWQVQSRGQDMIDLFLITPSLVITAVFVYRKSRVALLLWAGTVLYILYSFIIFCFAVHFNQLFLLYCFILGLSLYSLIGFVYYIFKNNIVFAIKKTLLIKFTGIYFLVIAVLFFLLWLSEIAPAVIDNEVPESLTITGLLTNPVHVIDLSVFLPGIFMTGLLVLKKRSAGFFLAQVMLTFFILMDITIGWLSFLMYQKGLEPDLSITIGMTVLTLLSIIILTWNLRNIKTG